MCGPCSGPSTGRRARRPPRRCRVAPESRGARRRARRRGRGVASASSRLAAPDKSAEQIFSSSESFMTRSFARALSSRQRGTIVGNYSSRLAGSKRLVGAHCLWKKGRAQLLFAATADRPRRLRRRAPARAIARARRNKKTIPNYTRATKRAPPPPAAPCPAGSAAS